MLTEESGMCRRRSLKRTAFCTGFVGGGCELLDGNFTRRKASKMELDCTDVECNEVAETTVATKSAHTCGETCKYAQNDYTPVLHINDLPSSILVLIFKFLPLSKLLKRAALVCKYWRKLSQDPALWRHIDLKGQLRASDKVLLRLTGYSKRVVSVDISSVQWITCRGFESMLQQCPHLEVLRMNWPSSIINDGSLGKIGEFCPNLQQLSLSSAYMLSDATMQKIGAGCPKLKRLSIGHCQHVSDEGIVKIARNCPDLKLLLIDKCIKVTEISIEALAAGCPQLSTLSATECNITGHSIKKMKNLVSLDISQKSDFSVVQIQDIALNCQKLERLNLSLIRTISDDDIRYIAQKLPRLKYLHLVGCDVTNNGLYNLANNCTSLIHLDVGWCLKVTDEAIQYIVRNCHDLRYFGLIRCDSVTMATLHDLMFHYPNVHFSNFQLDAERLLLRRQT